MYCSNPTDTCETCLELTGLICESTQICGFAPNFTAYVHFWNPYSIQYTAEFTADSDGCFNILPEDLPAGWWASDWKIEVQVSTDPDNCYKVNFDIDGEEYSCLIASFGAEETPINPIIKVCGLKVINGETEDQQTDFVEPTLIGFTQVAFDLDGTAVSSQYWTWNSTTGTLTLSYPANGVLPYRIIAG